MTKKKKIILTTLIVVAIAVIATVGLVFAKSNKKPAATPAPTPEVTEAPTEAPTATPDTKEGQVRSRLTNDWIPEEIGNRRPFAVMINNIKVATPQQCGQSQASILYEALAEGGITRLMGIFEDFDAKRIGSVRSARHYYVSYANEYDAIYCHFGQTKYAVKKIEKLGVDTLSGLSAIGSTVYFRDNSYHAPHNAFTSYDRIMKGVEKLKYRTTYREGYTGHYKFYNDDTDLSSDKTANKVTLKFSNYAQPYFEYDEKTKEYKRFQYGAKHIDANTKEQLTFKNVIIEFTKEWDIDHNGYQTMGQGNGEGLYITNGKAVKISWKKSETKKTMQFFAEDGSELTVNTGKTYIAIFPTDRQSDIVMK